MEQALGSPATPSVMLNLRRGEEVGWYDAASPPPGGGDSSMSSSLDMITQLPAELSVHVFSFLNDDSLCAASLVCWDWYYIANDDVLWKRKYKHRWGIPSPSSSITSPSLPSSHPLASSTSASSSVAPSSPSDLAITIPGKKIHFNNDEEDDEEQDHASSSSSASAASTLDPVFAERFLKMNSLHQRNNHRLGRWKKKYIARRLRPKLSLLRLLGENTSLGHLLNTARYQQIESSLLNPNETLRRQLDKYPALRSAFTSKRSLVETKMSFIRHMKSILSLMFGLAVWFLVEMINPDFFDFPYLYFPSDLSPLLHSFWPLFFYAALLCCFTTMWQWGVFHRSGTRNRNFFQNFGNRTTATTANATATAATSASPTTTTGVEEDDYGNEEEEGQDSFIRIPTMIRASLDTEIFLWSTGNSLLAGLLEECGFRFVYICTAMLSIVITNFVLGWGLILGGVVALIFAIKTLFSSCTNGSVTLSQVVKTLLCAVCAVTAIHIGMNYALFYLFYEWVIIPATNVFTLGKFSYIFYSKEHSRLLVFGMIAANSGFRDAHKYKGWIAWVNMWVIGFIMMSATLHYGLVFAIILHALYDLEFAVFTFVLCLLRNSTFAPSSCLPY